MPSLIYTLHGPVFEVLCGSCGGGINDNEPEKSECLLNFSVSILAVIDLESGSFRFRIIAEGRQLHLALLTHELSA